MEEGAIQFLNVTYRGLLCYDAQQGNRESFFLMRDAKLFRNGAVKPFDVKTNHRTPKKTDTSI